jgi:hypothetical protein
MPKPLVFIGGSSEESEVAREVQRGLVDIANVHPWWRTSDFGGEPKATTIELLLAAAREYDFGLFIFTPDDATISRGVNQFSARDNVLFEYGLFLGALGTQRTSAIIEYKEQKPPKDNIKIPTDLLGVQIKRFTNIDNDNLGSQIGVALSEFRIAIKSHGRRRAFAAHGEWKFDTTTSEFLFDIKTDSIGPHKHRMIKQKLLLIARKHDNFVCDMDDTSIVKGIPRGLSGTDDKIWLKAGGLGRFEQLTGGDHIKGYIYLVPKDVDVDACETMAALEDAGCRLLEGFPVGWTLPSELRSRSAAGRARKSKRNSKRQSISRTAKR